MKIGSQAKIDTTIIPKETSREMAGIQIIIKDHQHALNKLENQHTDLQAKVDEQINTLRNKVRIEVK